ncbi:MAG: hypothetical protein M3R59_04725 [Verrucomicrobiota bacterium]|nr:hypothetical protein [Verrucomicrobiota bacterium]
MKSGNLAGAIAASAITIVFCLLLLAHDPLVFWNDDYELSILPVCADMARAWNHGEFPLLSPYSWVCGNLAGEFQYGVFSIFINAAIVAIWKFSLTFPQQAAALAMVHLAALAPGAFLLARAKKISAPNALLVAIVATLSGWNICWGATDWLGALGAFTWLPWAWWAGERALEASRTRWRFLWPAPFVYLLTTGGFPYTVLMLALVFAWLCLRTFARSRRLTSVWPLVLGSALGLGLASPACLALAEYVQGSARSVQPASEHFQWLVPWRAWPGLILPSWTTRWVNFSSKFTPHGATELACGLVPPLALLAILWAEPRAFLKRWRWEIALLVIVFILCMTPTAGMFRWSFRWLPLFHLVLALCAGGALDLFWQSRSRLRLELFGVIVGALAVIAAHYFGVEGEQASPFTILLGVIVLLWAFVGLTPRAAKFRPWLPPYVAFAVLLATYLCLPPNGGVPKFDLPQSLLKPEPLDPQHLYLSIYPPPEYAYRLEAKTGPVGATLRLGSTSLWAALHFINGYSPIRPAGVARLFASEIHGEIDDATAAWLLEYEAGEDQLLARVGVDGIIVANENALAPLPASAWRLVAHTGEGRVYHRALIPPVRSVNWDDKHSEAGISDIDVARNRVSASVNVPASAPAAIIFSRPFFPGYRAEVNGKAFPVASYRGLIPLVELSAGTSGKLTLLYRPRWLLFGCAIAATSALAWIVSAIFALRTNISRRTQ